MRPSWPGDRRLIQMSVDPVWAFTEGYTDSCLYERVAGEVFRRQGFSFTIATADEIPDGGGGKHALLDFFDYAKRNNLLSGTFKEKTHRLRLFSRQRPRRRTPSKASFVTCALYRYGTKWRNCTFFAWRPRRSSWCGGVLTIAVFLATGSLIKQGGARKRPLVGGNGSRFVHFPF